MKYDDDMVMMTTMMIMKAMSTTMYRIFVSFYDDTIPLFHCRYVHYPIW